MDRSLEDQVSEYVSGNGRIVVLTGAGISAESGILIFRGEEGYWQVGSRNYHPQEMATFHTFCEMPDEVWAWYLYRRSVCRTAKPNAAHDALVRLEQHLGERFQLITQNVDGLHLRAGQSPGRTWQIHGDIEFMRCAKECDATLHPMPAAIGDEFGKTDKLDDRLRGLLVCPTCGRAVSAPCALVRRDVRRAPLPLRVIDERDDRRGRVGRHRHQRRHHAAVAAGADVGADGDPAAGG